MFIKNIFLKFKKAIYIRNFNLSFKVVIPIKDGLRETGIFNLKIPAENKKEAKEKAIIWAKERIKIAVIKIEEEIPTAK